VRQTTDDSYGVTERWEVYRRHNK